MLDELFGEGNYYDFPSFEVALYSLLLAFALSTVIALTYRWTFEGDRFPRHFFQAIVLSSTVSSMVIMAVGNNLAAGFGIIGAIAIIRFRTLIRNPRNIIFIFASLSVGIATGVYGYAIAIAGTLIFCVFAVLLYFSPYGPQRTNSFDISFTVIQSELVKSVEALLAAESIPNKILVYRKLDEGTGYRYTMRLTIENNEDELFRKLSSIEGLNSVRMAPSDEIEL